MHRVGSSGNTSNSVCNRKEKRLTYILNDANDTKVLKDPQKRVVYDQNVAPPDTGDPGSAPFVYRYNIFVDEFSGFQTVSYLKRWVVIIFGRSNPASP
ncbi:hypothetical protein ACS0TY_031314 [Phlomoides rotata]